MLDTRGQTRTVVGLCALAFAIIGGYEIGRTACESLFLASYGNEGLPKAWLAVAATAAVTVSVYNRFAGRAPLMRLLAGAAFVSTALLLPLLFLARAGVGPAIFWLYVWKDVYVVVLVEIFWTYANATFPLKQARDLYWLFCMMGSLGGSGSNLLVGAVAQRVGTVATLWGLPPVLILTGIGCALVPLSSQPTPSATTAKPGLAEYLRGFSVMKRSRDIQLLVALVATVQVTITLIDYSYNGALKAAFPNTDERTHVVGMVYGAVNAGAFVLQLLTSPILRLLGVPRALTMIPLLLGATFSAFLLSPAFALLGIAKVLSKSLDYSIFRAGKETLYIPLDAEEKLHGKPVVDVFSYRVAKAGASALLLGMVALGATGAVGALTIGLLVLWFLLTVRVGRRHSDRAKAPDAAGT